MIDLHCHLLPGLDDGAAELSVALDMARMLCADGVTVVACTPHILPGLYHNDGASIRSAVGDLQRALDDTGIALRLVEGADVHLAPNLVAGLRDGRIPSLAGSRYVLVEPPHHVPPPRLEQAFFELLVAGYVPILTHPERLTWIGSHYAIMHRLARAGVWMQVTAASLTGDFGRQAEYWGKRLLEDRIVHILATDSHDAVYRPPSLGRGRDAAERIIGAQEAEHLVLTRPSGVIANHPPSSLPLAGGTAMSGDSDGCAIGDGRMSQAWGSAQGRESRDTRGRFGLARRLLRLLG